MPDRPLSHKGTTVGYYAQINDAGTRWRLASPFDEPLSPWISRKRALELVAEVEDRERQDD